MTAPDRYDRRDPCEVCGEPVCVCEESWPEDDRDHVLDLTRPCWCGATAVGDLDVRDHDPADCGLRAVRDLRVDGRWL